MLTKEQIEYALHYAEDPVEWVFELVRGLEKQIDDLVKYGTKVTVFQEHWHPASELPLLDKDGNSQDVIVICGTTNLHFDLPRWSKVVNGIWGDKDVKWWTCPPEEE